MPCVYNASVTINADKTFRLNVSCKEHGEVVPTIDLKPEVIDDFLAEGMARTLTGDVPASAYLAVYDAFISAGYIPGSNLTAN